MCNQIIRQTPSAVNVPLASPARELQCDGDELRRHDITLYLIHHPCEMPIFQATLDAANGDFEAECEIVRQWQEMVFGNGAQR